jgi:hypothetical protein
MVATDLYNRMIKIDPAYTDKFEDFVTLFYDGLYQGNDDAFTDFEDGTRDIMVIQEDHYDQHMGNEDEDDEDYNEDKPPHDSMIAEVSGAYVFWAN